MSKIILRNIKKSHLAFLKNQPDFYLQKSEKKPDVFYAEADDLIELIQTRLTESQNLKSVKITSLLFYGIKEKIILLYLAEIGHVISFQTLYKHVFAQPEYEQYFKSKSPAVIRANLNKLAEFGYIKFIERGILKITEQGKKVAKLLKKAGTL